MKNVAKVNLRNKYLEVIKEAFSNKGEEILLVDSNKYAIPCVDENGEDEFIVITVSVPSGTHDGEPYDGYSEAEDYARKVVENERKAKEAEEKKKKKMEADEAKREKKRQNKLANAT